MYTEKNSRVVVVIMASNNVFSKLKVEKGYETEVRFGKYDNRGKFTPGVSVSQFDLLISTLDKVKVLRKVSTSDIVNSRTVNRTTSVRKISPVSGGKSIYERKEKVGTVDVPKEGIRLAKSKETPISQVEYAVVSNTNAYVQRRDRTSYTMPGARLDLTRLPRNRTTTYQVEIEYTDVGTVRGLLQSVHEVLNRWSIVRDYKALTKGSRFIGPLPQTLTLEAFRKKVLSKSKYSVTEKADGERFLLYVAPNGFFYFISRKMDFALAPYTPRPDLANSIMDGELSKDTFYAFDAAFIKGTSIVKQNLTKRLDAVLKFLMEVRDSRLKMKVFYVDTPNGIRSYPGNKSTKFKNIYEAAGDVWSRRSKFSYKLDGLIFTPVDDGYTSRSIYKWKDENTIDFYYKSGNGNKTRLFLAGLDARGNYSATIPFSGNDGKGTFKTAKGSVKNDIFTDTSVPDNVRKGELTVSIPGPSQVGEFKFAANTFKLIGKRPDKEFPNSVQASNQAWEAITKPVTSAMISVGPATMRDFHSEIKSKLIMKYAKDKSVLDIGSGKGEDIGKYLKAKSKPVVGFDMVGVEYNHPNYMKFFKMNTPIYNIQNKLKNTTYKGPFDIININFALHYFFKNKETFQNLILNINRNLKKGGYLMATVLDGRMVYNALKNKNKNITNTANFTKKYNNALSFNNKKFKMLGRSVNVLVKGTKYFTKPIEEYLFNFQKFMLIMEQLGYEVVETKNFSELCDGSPWCSKYMSNSEKEYSFKNMYFVLRKK